jgi:gamma-D-glutamyl-L-lysine dipeptidyl-peptidase
MYGICNLSLVPCRKAPSNASEMVTQLLFGEHFTVLESRDGWAKIVTAYDQYECFVNEKQFSPISFKTFSELEKEHAVLSNEFISILHNKSSSAFFPLLIGSVLPFYKNGTLHFEKEEFSFEGNIIHAEKKSSPAGLIETAKQFLEAPYLWGGRSVFGIDCSGFTQLVFKLCGIKLPRDAYQQATVGTTLSFVEEAKAGDLAFFDNEAGKIVHVGIIMENSFIIHASGKVRIDKFDHHGIFNAEKKKYSHNLRLIKSPDDGSFSD